MKRQIPGKSVRGGADGSRSNPLMYVETSHKRTANPAQCHNIGGGGGMRNTCDNNNLHKYRDRPVPQHAHKRART